MANTTVVNKLRGLSLGATELRELTGWPDPMIEDYLALLDNLLNIAKTVDVKNDILKVATKIDATMSPYELSNSDEEVFFDTTLGDVVAQLREGEDGRNYRLISVGTGGNKVIVTPFGTELLFGVNAPEHIYDYEALVVTFEEDLGGWN